MLIIEKDLPIPSELDKIYSQCLSLISSSSSFTEVKLDSLSDNELLALLISIAQGYVVNRNIVNRFLVSRTVLGEYFLSSYSKSSTTLPFLLIPLFYPTRTHLLYFVMNYANTIDPEDIAHSLRSLLFTGMPPCIQKIALAVYLELEGTRYFEKYSSRRTLVTPSHYAYVFARQLNEFIGFEEFLKILHYFYRIHDLRIPTYIQESVRGRSKELLLDLVLVGKLEDIYSDSELLGDSKKLVVFQILKKLERDYGNVLRKVIAEMLQVV